MGLALQSFHVFGPPSAASSDLWVDAAARTLILEPPEPAVHEPICSQARRVARLSSRPLSCRSMSLDVALDDPKARTNDSPTATIMSRPVAPHRDACCPIALIAAEEPYTSPRQWAVCIPTKLVEGSGEITLLNACM